MDQKVVHSEPIGNARPAVVSYKVLRQICHLRPTHPHWKNQEDICFTNTVKDKLVREAPASLKSSVIILFSR